MTLVSSLMLGLVSLLDILSYTERQHLIHVHRYVGLLIFALYVLTPLYYCILYVPGNYLTCQLPLVLVALSTVASAVQAFDLTPLTKKQSRWISDVTRWRMPFEIVAVLLSSPVQLAYTAVMYFTLWAILKSLIVRR